MIEGNQKSAVSCARRSVQPVAPCPSHDASPGREEEREQDAPRLKSGSYRAGDKVSLKVSQVLPRKLCPSFPIFPWISGFLFQ